MEHGGNHLPEGTARDESRRKYLEKRARDLAQLRLRQVQAETELLQVAAEAELVDAAALESHKRTLHLQAAAASAALKRPCSAAAAAGGGLRAVLKDETADAEQLLSHAGGLQLLFDEDRNVLQHHPQQQQDQQPQEEPQEETPALPIAQYRGEIEAAVRQYPALILIGETGSGKTTQLPQYLYDMACTGTGKIAVTQPRRVAAMSVSARVATEMNTRLGELVGYRVRFEQCVSAEEGETKIEFLTDGMLLKQFSLDPLLSQYSAVVVDEAHERSVATDLILALLKEVLKVRGDADCGFRVVVASATINAGLFSEYFNQAPVFNVPGRRFPVHVFHAKQTETDYVAAAALVVLQIHLVQARRPGDVLVFLPGEAEIADCIAVIEDKWRAVAAAANAAPGAGAAATPGDRNWLELAVQPMFGNLPQEQQSAVFERLPRGVRKVIVSSNICETSITVPGIKFVVDSGMVRQNHFSSLTGVEELQTVRVSRASADQRTGRAGRNEPGVCYRLYTKNMYSAEMEKETPPEILRCDLSQVLLQLKGIGVHDVLNFDWIQRPPVLSMQRALKELFSLGLLAPKTGGLSHIGALVEALPVDVKYGRAIVQAAQLKVLEQVVTVVSMWSQGGALVSRRRQKEEQQAQKPQTQTQKQVFDSRRMFFSAEGDALMMLEIFRQWEQAQYSSLWCREHGVQFKALKRARDIRNQLLSNCAKLGLSSESLSDASLPAATVGENVTRAFCAGFFMNSARLSRGSYALFASKEPVDLHPDSCLARTGTACVLFTELVFTSRLFARNVMRVKPEWLAEAGGKNFRKLLVSDQQPQPQQQESSAE